MVGEIEPEHFALFTQELLQRPCGHGRQRRLRRFHGMLRAEEGDLLLVHSPRRVLRPAESTRDRLEELRAISAERVARAGQHQRLHDPLVDGLQIHAAAELPDRRVRPAALARRHDRLDRALPDVLDRGQAEADRVPLQRERGAASVHVRRKHRDPKPARFLHERDDAVRVPHLAGERRREV